MEKVFIVMRGENYEGGFVDSVFSNREDAEARKAEIENGEFFASCEWVSVEEQMVVFR